MADVLEQPIPCVIISDPGEDLDDEMAMIMLRHLVDKKLLDCQGVVVNLKPSLTRARLMRGTLDTLGLRGVPVGVGTDGGSSMHRETFCETAKVYIPDEHEQRTRGLLTGRGLLHRIFVDAEPKSLHLICISSLKDAALFMRDNMVLFVEKVNSVTIMGGVHEFAEADETGLLQPDTAQNNVYDEASSEFFYRRCQELRVPLVILCRHAAYACPVSKRIYDTMKRPIAPLGFACTSRRRRASRTSGSGPARWRATRAWGCQAVRPQVVPADLLRRGDHRGRRVLAVRRPSTVRLRLYPTPEIDLF